MNTKPNRQTIRLKQHDYTSCGSYFITICTHNRSHLFGEIIDGVVILNDTDRMVHQCWQQIPVHFPNANIDNFVIMPNHIHGIIHMHPVSPVGANHYLPVFFSTNNQTNFPDKLTIRTLQQQNVNFTHNDNDGNLCENGDCGCSPGIRANDDSWGIRANDDSPLRDRWENGTSNSVGSIVRGFKIGVTKFCRQQNPDCIVWQRNYWEHIIRDREQYNRIQHYITNNPQKWYLDKLNNGCGNQVLEPSMMYEYESWMV
jgi:REP element-mobilizing transposase RayT